MANLLCDGIEQATASSDLSIETTRDILGKLSDNSGASFFKVQDSANQTVFEVDSDGNTRVVGDLTVEGTTTTIDSNTVNIGDNYLTLNADNASSVTNSDAGILNKRIVSSTINSTSIVGATRTINTSVNPTSTLAANDIVAITGTDNNDGLYEVDSVTASTVVVKSSSTLPGIASGGSLVDETIAFTITRSNPSYMGFEESNDSFEFGIIGDAGAIDSYSMIGIGNGGATAFSASDPDITLSGTSSANSFAAFSGFNSTGLTNTSADNVQDAIADMDSAIAGAGASFATPAFSFGTTASAGVAATVVRSDATIALFDATVPTTIEPDDAASAGSAGVAARRDHVHAIATAAPVAVGTANAEGASTSFARADHVHDHGDLSSAADTFIFHESHNIEVAPANFTPANYTATAGGDGNAAFTSIEDHLRGIDTVLATIPSPAPSFATPALTFGTTNTAGSASTVIRSDAQLALFDATVPTTIEPDDAAAAGSAGVAARRDHTHAIATAAPLGGLGTANAEGTSTSFARADHVHLVDSNGPAQKFGKEDIGSGATSVSVVYTTAFAATPTVVIPSLVRIGGAADPQVTMMVTASSTTGFTVTLSGPTPNANYDMHWMALA